MQSRVFRLTLVAAAASVILAVGLWPGREGKSPGVAYAFSDLPELIAQKRYLRIQGTRTIAGGTSGFVQAPVDDWFDLATGARRSLTTHARGGGIMRSVFKPGHEQGQVLSMPGGETRATTVVTVFDGEYEMVLDPANKTATFNRLSPVLQRLTIARAGTTALQQLFGDPSRLSGFKLAGQETVDGITCEIWENEWSVTPENTISRLTRCWFEAEAGDVIRVQEWTRAPFTNGEYIETMLVDRVDRGVVPPPGTFETVPPDGYTASNTREEAPLRGLSAGASAATMNARVRKYPAFVLPDGSVILGISSGGINGGSQEALFANLVPGGELPKLPIEVYGLRASNGPEVTYTGRHLAWTLKDGEYIEWGLYVPDRTPPSGILGVNFLTRTNPHRPNVSGGIALGTEAPFPVDAASFDDLVVAAMAELNDAGTAPSGMTYESVTQLVQQIKSSLK